MQLFCRKNQQGSASLTLVASIFAVSLASLYVYKSSQQQQNDLKQAARENMQGNVEISNLSTLSRFRSLLNNRNSGSGRYVPPLFAQNYYASTWHLAEDPNLRNKAYKLESARSVSLSNLHDVSLREASQVMRGRTSTSFPSRPNRVEILRSNFSNNLRMVNSIDVRVTHTTGSNTAVSSMARIPLDVPEPWGVKLQISPAGRERFSDNISQITPGLYDIRVLASGVAFDATILINGIPIRTVGGFKLDGTISHLANNVLAVDQEVGRISSFPFGAADGQMSGCSYVPVDGNYSLAARVTGPDGKVGAKASIAKQVVIREEDIPRDKLDEVYATACNDKCPYVGATRLSDLNFADYDPRFQRRQYGDSANAMYKESHIFKHNILKRKLCQNFEPSAKQFHARFRSWPMTWNELFAHPDILESSEFVAYDVKTCKRTKLFTRNGCGCFAADAKIMLADGKTKPISELSYEDRIWNPKKQTSYGIRRISRGPERVPMLKVLTTQHELEVTGKHPFSTRDGLRTAHQLQVGDEIPLASNEWVKIVEIKTFMREAAVVWNVELDAPHHDLDAHQLVANGLVTGDLYVQTLLEGAPIHISTLHQGHKIQ